MLTQGTLKRKGSPTSQMDFEGSKLLMLFPFFLGCETIQKRKKKMS